jgi:hypothetical protein
MKDREGAGWQLGLAGVGWGLFAAAVALGAPNAVYAGIPSLFLLSTNFTYNIVRSITYDKPGSQNNKFDMYFAPKYQFPIGTPVSWGGVNVESGMIWGNGAFAGLDFNYSISEDDHNKYNNFGLFLGGGLSLGNIYDFGNRLYLVYGGAVGLWWGREEKKTGNHYKYRDGTFWPGDYERYEYLTYNFLSPFVKLRWKYLELTYRGLVGFWEEKHGYHYFSYGTHDDYKSDDGFNWNHHQLMFGLYFATNKRQR